jgi:exoribonuclease-2
VGAQGLARGARVRVALGDIDEISLDVRGTVIERLGDAAAAPAAGEEDEQEEEAAGPLAIAVDVSVAGAEADPTEPVPA